jgi:hypothetical protein
MAEKQIAKPVALAVGAALAGSFAVTGTASADTGVSPFSMTTLSAGYLLGAAATSKPKKPKAAVAKANVAAIRKPVLTLKVVAAATRKLKAPVAAIRKPKVLAAAIKRQKALVVAIRKLRAPVAATKRQKAPVVAIRKPKALAAATKKKLPKANAAKANAVERKKARLPAYA